MKFFICTSLFFFGIGSLVAADVRAVCTNAAELEASLVDWHNETLASWNGSDTYVWSSGVGGSWTVVKYVGSGSDMIACVIDQGRNWTPKLNEYILLASTG